MLLDGVVSLNGGRREIEFVTKALYLRGRQWGALERCPQSCPIHFVVGALALPYLCGLPHVQYRLGGLPLCLQRVFMYSRTDLVVSAQSLSYADQMTREAIRVE